MSVSTLNQPFPNITPTTMSSSSKHEHLHAHPHEHHHQDQVGLGGEGPRTSRGIVYAPPALRSPVLSGVAQRVAVVCGVIGLVWIAVWWALQNNG
jgi:hypothetical protein